MLLNQVGLIISLETYNEVLKEIAKVGNDRYNLIRKASVIVNDKYAVLLWDDIVWDNENKGVRYINNLRKKVDSYLIRIGDDEYTDIEDSFNGGDTDMIDLLTVNRNINVRL